MIGPALAVTRGMAFPALSNLFNKVSAPLDSLARYIDQSHSRYANGGEKNQEKPEKSFASHQTNLPEQHFANDFGYLLQFQYSIVGQLKKMGKYTLFECEFHVYSIFIKSLLIDIRGCTAA